MNMEIVPYNGWPHNGRLANHDIELIVTQDVGPRVIRFAFIGEENIFGELPGQQGQSGETEWMIRGGHRLWIAPEDNPKSYDLDNGPITLRWIEGGLETDQAPSPLTGVQKSMRIQLSATANTATILHRLTNAGSAPTQLSSWALTVMNLRGTTLIPLPKKIRHTDRLLHNQNWSLWGYTDFTDPRWTLGSRYICFRQDPLRGPNKLGLAHREGWVGYLRNGTLFVKRFPFDEQAVYPDGGVNFETFANEQLMEIETLGPLATLAPGQSVTHQETWELYRHVPDCATEADIDRHILPLITR